MKPTISIQQPAMTLSGTGIDHSNTQPSSSFSRQCSIRSEGSIPDNGGIRHLLKSSGKIKNLHCDDGGYPNIFRNPVEITITMSNNSHYQNRRAFLTGSASVIATSLGLGLISGESTGSELNLDYDEIDAEGTANYEVPGTNGDLWCEFTHGVTFEADPGFGTVNVLDRWDSDSSGTGPGSPDFVWYEVDDLLGSGTSFTSHMAGRFMIVCEDEYVDLHVEISGFSDGTFDVETWSDGDIGQYCLLS